MTFEVKLFLVIMKYVIAWEICAQEINNGCCGEFADMVIESLGGETEDFYGSFTEELYPGHCWITYKDKHYDAECPQGVEDSQNLPFFQRIAQETI